MKVIFYKKEIKPEEDYAFVSAKKTLPNAKNDFSSMKKKKLLLKERINLILIDLSMKINKIG